jgi:hypothetical protein
MTIRSPSSSMVGLVANRGRDVGWPGARYAGLLEAVGVVE